MAELRSSNHPLADLMAQRFGPEVGAMVNKAIAYGSMPAEFAYKMSGIPMAADGGRALGEASVTGDTMKGAGGLLQIGAGALPFSGPIGRAALATVPRATLTGVGAASAPILASGALSSPVEAQTAKQARGIAAAKERETKAAKDLMTAQSANDAARIKREQDAARVQEAEGVRQSMLDSARKPFDETFPNWARVQPFLPAAVGTATALPATLLASIATRGAAGRWRNAVASGENAATPSALAAAAGKAEAFANEMPKLNPKSFASSYAAPAVVGGLEGAAITNAPEAYNAFLPSENPERKAYEEYIKRLPADSNEARHAKTILDSLPTTQPARTAALDYFGSSAFPTRTGVGAMEGLGGALFGTTMGKLAAPAEKALPRAETKALLERLAEQNRLTQAQKHMVTAADVDAALIAARQRAATASEMPAAALPIAEMIPAAPAAPKPMPPINETPAMRARRYLNSY